MTTRHVTIAAVGAAALVLPATAAQADIGSINPASGPVGTTVVVSGNCPIGNEPHRAYASLGRGTHTYSSGVDPVLDWLSFGLGTTGAPVFPFMPDGAFSIPVTVQANGTNANGETVADTPAIGEALRVHIQCWGKGVGPQPETLEEYMLDDTFTVTDGSSPGITPPATTPPATTPPAATPPGTRLTVGSSRTLPRKQSFGKAQYKSLTPKVCTVTGRKVKAETPGTCKVKAVSVKGKKKQKTIKIVVQ